MKLFFICLIYSMPLSVSAKFISGKLIYSIQKDEIIKDNKSYVVEREYKYFFDKVAFEASVKKVFSTINSYTKKNNIIEVDLTNCSQSIFVERYFKFNGYDAHLADGLLKIYPQKIFEVHDEIL